MRLSLSSSSACFLLVAAAFTGSVSSQNIRSRLLGDEASYKQVRRTNRKAQSVIEIPEQTDAAYAIRNNHVTTIWNRDHENHPIVKELETIFAEELDHWDRMLDAYSLPPTKPPTSNPPTAKPPVEEPSSIPSPPVESPSSVPSYLPTPAPSDEEAEEPTNEPNTPTNIQTYTPTPADIPATSPTAAPSTTAPSVSGPTAETPRPTTLPATTWDILLSRPDQFSTLIAVAEAVRFDGALRSDEDRTIFAPSNDAFRNLLPADLLEKYFDFEKWTDEYIVRLLFCHDIAGSIIFSFQFQNGTKVLPCLDFLDPAYLITTPPLQISKNTMPTPANVTEGDLLARNGVVHVIDQVLTNSFLRLALPAAANAFGGFEILLDLIDTAGLLDVLSGPGPFTVFAPPDEVFLGYGEGFIEDLKADQETLRQVLLNHVVTDIIIPCCQADGATFESAAGFPIVIADVEATEVRNFTVNGVNTIPVLTGLLASNAKVNAISDILFLPTSPVAPVIPPTDSPVVAPTEAPVIQPTDSPGAAPATTWGIITSRPEEFATFIAASEATGFDAVLQETINRTVFVPNEAAFGSVMPAGLLEKYFDFDTWTREYMEILLFCHELTDAVILSTDLSNGTTISPCMDLIDPGVVVTTPPPRLSKETMPEAADIVEVDLIADNGVVHVIDQVITNSFLRYDFVAAATFAGGYTILLELLELTGLNDFASGTGPFTIFAPPDEVFESYGEDFINDLKADINGTTNLLLNHVVPNIIIPCCLDETSEFFSAAGVGLVLGNFNPNNPSEYTVSGIATIPAGTDLLTSNAKVNTISDILFPVSIADPPTFSPTPKDNTVPPTPGEPGSRAPSTAETLAPSSVSAEPTDFGPTLGPLPAETVWDVVVGSSDQFATFISAAEAVGYDELLRTTSEITVFVPNEDAFNNMMPPDLLVKYFSFDVWTAEYIIMLLACHDIAGAAILSSELTNGAEFANCMDLIDPEFRFSSPPPMIEKSTMPVPANIVGPDQESLNGVVHTVDQVLTTSFLRFDMPSAAEALRTFSILLELVVLTDLLTFVSGEGPFTIFAPSDAVFERYGAEFIDGLKKDVAGTRDLLLNHVVADQIVPCCLEEATEFTSAAGFPLVLDEFSRSNSNIFTVNGIDTNPMLANFLTSNAKINEITDFLLPPNLQ